MPYILAEDEKPMSGVDVYVVTDGGHKGIAKYWDVLGRWLTADQAIHDEKVKKWKYAEAS